MKKILLVVLSLLMTASAFAQFEQGKKYVGASLSGLDLSYNDEQKFHCGLNASAGYFAFDDILFSGNLSVDYGSEDWQKFSAGLKAKYYIEQNGITLAAGLKYCHLFKSYNELALTPEIGYCFFVNHYVAIEPSLYFDMSLTNFSERSKVGLNLGIGIYF